MLKIMIGASLLIPSAATAAQPTLEAALATASKAVTASRKAGPECGMDRLYDRLFALRNAKIELDEVIETAKSSIKGTIAKVRENPVYAGKTDDEILAIAAASGDAAMSDDPVYRLKLALKGQQSRERRSSMFNTEILYTETLIRQQLAAPKQN